MSPADPDQTRKTRHDRIEDFICRWHDAQPGELDGPLHEELGWTWQEYCAYVERNVLPPEREGAI
jgi:hypothetical protein